LGRTKQPQDDDLTVGHRADNCRDRFEKFEM
jgi:hypothetical protein